jgi:hypothetical protein
MTLLMEALGKRDDAFKELARAIDENSASLYILDVDPQMDSLRGDARFARLRTLLQAGSPNVSAGLQVPDYM